MEKIEKKKINLNHSFDLKSMYPEEVISSIGLDILTLEELFELLRGGVAEAKSALENGLCDTQPGVQEYHAIGKKYARVAFHIYWRLWNEKKELRLPAYLAINRHRSSNDFPVSILFWADPDAIRGLYEALEADGWKVSA